MESNIPPTAAPFSPYSVNVDCKMHIITTTDTHCTITLTVRFKPREQAQELQSCINIIIHHSIILLLTLDTLCYHKHDCHLELHHADDTTLNKETTHSVAVIN